MTTLARCRYCDREIVLGIGSWHHTTATTHCYHAEPLGAPLTTAPTDWRARCLDYIYTNFAYEHLPEGPMRESSRAVFEHALNVIELGTPNRMLFNSLDFLLLHKDAFVRSHLVGQK